MSRRLTLLFLGLGLTAFALQIRHLGIGRLWNEVAAAGWILLPVILFYALAHVCDTQAWRVILKGEPNRPGWIRLFRMVISGSALNFLTPVVNLGGEPFKIATLASALGTGRATGAIVIRNVVRALGLLGFWFAATISGWFLLPATPLIHTLLLASAGGIMLVTALLTRAHRHGGLAQWFDGLARLPWVGPRLRRAEGLRPAIELLDRQITGFARDHPGRLALAAGYEFLGRAFFVVEFCLIGWAIGIPVRYPAAFTIGGLETLVGNLLFFVPYEIGTRESATMLLFSQLGYPAEAGLFAALVSRLRDLAWILAGVVIVGLAADRSTASATT
jgi:hypothetical protein